MNDLFDKMDEEQASRVAYLIAGYVRHTLTEEEHDELDEWITANDDNQRLFEELTDPDNIERGLRMMGDVDVDKARERVKSKIKFTEQSEVRKKRRWLPYSIAASLIVVTGLVLFFMPGKKSKTGNDPIAKEKNVIQPGGNYATLTLGNGKTINLFDAKNGLIDSTNGNEVLKTADGQISYANSLHSTDVFHVLSTPTGGQYKVVLPDSTTLWLNSSSSLRYPVVFNDKERVVELSGEGYFEVASSNAPSREGHKIPFIVKIGDARVEVQGTHFNVNAYKDEENIKTTLFEGRVRVYTGSPGMVSELEPGDQAQMSKPEIKVVHYADPRQFVAWKDGEFQFENAMIEDIMRQVSRWYGADVVYESKIDHHFNATIKRNEPIEKLLYFLQETNEVHFRVEGKRVVVMK